MRSTGKGRWPHRGRPGWSSPTVRRREPSPAQTTAPGSRSRRTVRIPEARAEPIVSAVWLPRRPALHAQKPQITANATNVHDHTLVNTWVGNAHSNTTGNVSRASSDPPFESAYRRYGERPGNVRLNQLCKERTGRRQTKNGQSNRNGQQDQNPRDGFFVSRWLPRGIWSNR